MSTSPQTIVRVDEIVPLNTIPGSSYTSHNGKHVINCIERCAASCCDDSYHRKLAICSIICGVSCIGIKALIYSVKAETTTGPERAKFSKRAKKFGIMSIVIWVSVLASIPILMALISYLVTLRD